MKSELVFSASRKIENRYLLCRVVARTVRTLHFASVNTQDAITDAFVRIGSEPATSGVAGLSNAAESVWEQHHSLPREAGLEIA